MERDDEEGLPARVREALEAQWAVTHAMQRVNMPEWIHLELSLGQLKTLMALASLGAMNVSGLAERLEVGKPAASIVVDRLVQLGYAERTEDTQDRRRTLVAPTAKGNELVRRLRQGSGGRMIARWMERMDASDLDALTRGLRALAAAAAEETGVSAALRMQHSPQTSDTLEMPQTPHNE
jgi:DNA-binding MarR family transcriptional regulator